MKKVLIVVGTRPNFIKVTRFKKVAAERGTIDVRIVHTGQHFDDNMSQVFFRELMMPAPHFNLDIHGGPHAMYGVEFNWQMQVHAARGWPKGLCLRYRRGPAWPLTYGRSDV